MNQWLCGCGLVVFIGMLVLLWSMCDIAARTDERMEERGDNDEQ